MKAALDGLDAVKGDLSGGQAKYREALKNLKLKTPTGEVTLDENRQAIGTTFVTEVAKAADGGFYNKVVKVGAGRQPAARHVARPTSTRWGSALATSRTAREGGARLAGCAITRRMLFQRPASGDGHRRHQHAARVR